MIFPNFLEKYGKDFNDIRQDFLPWKSPSNLIEYYYLWKTTDRYVQQKRVKAVEAESKLKQVYIPTYTKPHPAAIGPAGPASKNGAGLAEIGLGPGKACDCCAGRLHFFKDLQISNFEIFFGCKGSSSVQWYAWSPPSSSSSTQPLPTQSGRLCQPCWQHWKKYGDLKVPSKSGVISLPTGDAGEAETKVLFSSPSTGVDALTSRPHRCSIQGCGKVDLSLVSFVFF